MVPGRVAHTSFARADALLRDQSPHGRPHLRPPADPRHLSRAPALRDAADRHRCLPIFALHVPRPPAHAARHAGVPAGPTVDAAAGSARRTGVPCTARRATAASPATEDEGDGSAALAANRGGPEARNAGEHRPPAYDRQLRRQETRDGFTRARTEHTDECQDGEEAQQGRAAPIILLAIPVHPKTDPLIRAWLGAHIHPTPRINKDALLYLSYKPHAKKKKSILYI